MSCHSQYGYYDPVGSNQPQPTGYTHQSTSNAPSFPSASASSRYGSTQQNYGSSGYSAQSYNNSAQTNTSASHAAAALSSVGNQDYNQTSRRNSSAQYDDPQWYGSHLPSRYGNSNPQPSNRSQANNSPLYASTQSSTFGRLSVPEHPQNTSNSTYGSSSTYQNALSSVGTNYRHQSNTNQPAQNPPQRYNSPLHAVQAQQQSHQKQASRGSNHQPSSQTANAARYTQEGRKQSASVEPSLITVDPSQVYDNGAELERKARHDAERRKKIEAEQATKKAEEDRLAAEKRKGEEAAEPAKWKEQQERKNEQRRKAREEKQQSKSAGATLQQMASIGAESSASGAAGDDEEAEMRAIFKKMREFNSKNPAMLAKLWEEERKQHADSQSPQAEKAMPAPAPANTTHSRQSAAQAQPKSTAPPVKSPSQQKAIIAAKGTIGLQTSPQATPSRPAASSSSTSLWPPHKKGALADVTAKWLTELPENAGKTISQQAVLNILNSNPSYVQLCESLESLGMRFERSTLARELLKAVPDGLRTTQQKPSALVSTASQATSALKATLNAAQTSKQTSPSAAGVGKPRSSSGSGTVSYSTPLSLSDAAREVNGMHKAQAQYGGAVRPPQPNPSFSQSQTLTNCSRPPSQARAASLSQPPEDKPEIPPEEPPREPADKEEAARKRTFGDLVDLTKDDESDDDGPPRKKTFQLPLTAPAPASDANIQYRDPLAYLQQFEQSRQQQPYKPFSYQPQQSGISGSGIMHPQRRPQQVVPSNQSAPPPKPKGPSAEQLQHSRMRGRMLVEPIMRDRVARKSRYDSSTIARDVLLATGRHPDMRGLNAHLNNMQKLLGHHGGEVDSAGTRCDLSTIRWDIIDPEQPKEHEKSTIESKAARSRPSSVDSLAAPDAPQTTTVNYETPSTSAPGPEKKKRGPKPRASVPGDLTQRGLGVRAYPNTPARPTSAHHDPSSAPDPAVIAHADAMAAQGTPVGYSAFRQIGPDGQVIKKKGRPVGWRKSLHSREAQGMAPYPSKNASSKPKEARVSKSLVEPHWQSFHCEWQGCKAELQNLDTLKKHIAKVHRRKMDVGRGYQCLWRDCDRQPGDGGGFAEIEEWMLHVDKAHLQPVAWKQGDGPTGGSLGDSHSFHHSAFSSPAYLNDAYGRSVTPVIEPTPPPERETHQPNNPIQTLPIHPSTAPATTRPIGRPPKDGIPKLERDAGAELHKLAEHKRIVGPTIDRQGCVLASEERRRTFLGDEDFEDVVEGSKVDDVDAWD